MAYSAERYKIEANLFDSPKLKYVVVDLEANFLSLTTESAITCGTWCFALPVGQSSHNVTIVNFKDSFNSECIDRGISFIPSYVSCPDSSSPLWGTNHSCYPNAGVENFGEPINVSGEILVPIVAYRNIEPGEEILIDYSCITTKDDGGDNEFAMDCLCNNPECRKVVTSFSKLPRDIQMGHILQKSVIAHILEEEFISQPDLRHQIQTTYPEIYRSFEVALEKQKEVSENLKNN